MRQQRNNRSDSDSVHFLRAVFQAPPLGRPRLANFGMIRLFFASLLLTATFLLAIGRPAILPGLLKPSSVPVSAAKILISRIADLQTLRIGVVAGTTQDIYVTEHFPQAAIQRYKAQPDLVLAIKGNKIDAAALALTSARVITEEHPDLGILNEPMREAIPKGVGFNKNNPELLAQFNQFLKEIRADGTLDEMISRWIDTSETMPAMPDIPRITSGEPLKVGVVLSDLPYVALINGRYVGFDAEMQQRFALWLQRPLEMVDFEFAAIIMGLVTGKVDVIADGISITAERARQVNFSDPYLPGYPTVVLALKSNLAITLDGDGGSSATGDDGDPSGQPVGPVTLWQKLQASFHNNLIVEQRYRLILAGLETTAILSLLSAFWGTLLGLLVCWLSLAKSKLLNSIASVYVTILRGLPVLVLLLIIYYVVLARVNISPVLVAVVAFGMNFAGYAAEMFRSAILSIDRGQTEAGLASGFSAIQTFIHIVLPQAVRQVMPVYKGELISLVKTTSVVGYIAVEDLTKASDIIRSRTFDAFFPLLLVSLLYFILAGLLTTALDSLNRRVSRKRKTS